MKIALISMVPGIHDFGLRTISACLKQAGHDVNMFFLKLKIIYYINNFF